MTIAKAPTKRTGKRSQRQREIVELHRLTSSQSPENVRAAIIRAWAAANDVSTATLSRCTSVQKLLDSGSGEIESLARRIRQHQQISLKLVESVFESVIDAHRRKQQGAVYTPDFIIDYLLRVGLDIRETQDKVPRFCDPACGSGGFLIRAAEMMTQQFGITLREAFSKFVRGLDIDELAVEHARCLISLHLIQQQSFHESVVTRCVQQCDTLLAKPDEVKAAIGFAGGVDLLATNPPYVKLQNLDPAYRLELLNRHSEFANGSYGLALLFLIAGHQLLAENGVLAYITQNNLFTSLAGKEARAYLQSHKCIRRIVDFQHERIFPSVRAYTCLVFLGRPETPGFEFERISGRVDAAALKNATFSEIAHDSLDAKKWRLAKQPHLDHLRRIERAGMPLGKLAKIKVGFATLKDSVFLLDGVCDTPLQLFRTNDGYEVELAVTRPAVKIADADSEADLLSNERRVLFPYHQSDGRWTIISESNLASCFPSAYSYLLSNRNVLATRDKGRRKYEAWYAWSRTQGRDAPGPKLLTKTFNSRPNFMLDDTDQLFCNGYSVSLRCDTMKSLPGMTLTCLQRILNSSVMDYYTKLTSFQIEGDFQCYQKNFIEQFGIPSLSPAESDELELCHPSQVDDFVRRLYDIPVEHIASECRTDR